MDRERRYWLDRKENVTRIYWSVWTVCGLLLLVEPFLDKHGDLSIEDWVGFHGFFGFVGCVGLILAAKGLRRIVMRREDYYDR